jgi:hypothetical protein
MVCVLSRSLSLSLALSLSLSNQAVTGLYKLTVTSWFQAFAFPNPELVPLYASAHHTLAIMHFNGSGGKRKDKDPEAGAALCARGNILFGSIPAKRELGHCLQDGFGVEQDAPLGRRMLAEAATEDVQTPAVNAAVSAATAAAATVEERLRKRNDITTLNAAVAAAAEVSAAAKDAAEVGLCASCEFS